MARDNFETDPGSTAAVRQELAATRERMSGTIVELEQRVSGRIDSVKQKIDVVGLVKEHPWPALTIAFATGLALSATGADRKAASATTQAAKRAPDAAKRGVTQAAHATAAGVSQLASAAAEKFRGSPDAASNTEGSAGESGGLIAKTTGALRAQVRELGEEVQRGADELSGSAPPPRRSSGI
jgi:hypothetical protein